MIRDFSEAAKDELYDQIDSVTPNGLWEILVDCVSDWGYHLQSWIGLLCIDRYLNNVKCYHKKILDKNNTSKQEINQIFEDIAYIDDKYCKPLEFLREELKACTGFTCNLARIIQPGNRMLTKELCVNLRVQIENSGIKKSLENLKDNIDNSGTDVNGMNMEMMREYVVLYEMIYSEHAGKIDRILESDDVLTQEDRVKMKYIAYTAEEPYRTVYFQYIDEYQLGSIGGAGVDGAYYSSSQNGIYFNNGITSFSQDERGPYTTWFHESGHATDGNAGEGSNFYCYDYTVYLDSFGKEVTLQEAIYSDVYNDIRCVIQDYAAGTDEAISVDNVLNTFRYGVDESQLTDAEMEIRRKVLVYYDNELAGAVNEAACDVYGGVTNLEIGRTYGYGHRPDSKDENGKKLSEQEYQEAIDNYRYWYDSNGNATLSQSKELVAEYFSYHMTGNTAALKSLEEHFPQAILVLDQMFIDMVKEN